MLAGRRTYLSCSKSPGIHDKATAALRLLESNLPEKKIPIDKSIVIVGKATDMDAMCEAVGRGAARQLPTLHVLEDVKTFRADEFFAKIVQGCC